MRYLVIGGSGFLGSYITQALVDRGEKFVAVYGRTKPREEDVIGGVDYYCGDVLDEAKLDDCLQKTSANTVFHTVSPPFGLEENLLLRVNVEGTATILRACRKARVKYFIYTSSTSVVWNGTESCGLSEDEVSMPEEVYEWYAHTKALAEKMVLRENGASGMTTVSIRPCGMIGPRDRLSMWRLADAYNKGQHKHQMGDNRNLVDFTYAGNVADAHLLAADRLASDAQPPISGEAFFITDDKPVPFWTVPHIVFKKLGWDGDGVVVLPHWFCLVLAFLSELWARWVTGGPPAISHFTVTIATQEQYYNIDKAKRLLDYRPRVALEEGVSRMVNDLTDHNRNKWWKERGEREHYERMNSEKLRKSSCNL